MTELPREAVDLTWEHGEDRAMAIWLFSGSVAWARYELATGRLSEGLPRPSDEEPVLGETLHGWYCRLDGTLVLFYAWESRLWLRIGDVERACTSPATAHWIRQPDEMARLSLVDGNEIVASVVYFGGDEWGIPAELDFTMTSAEDFDFGEFIRRFLDDTDKVRSLAGDDVAFDPSGALAPEAQAAIDALPPMTRQDLALELPHLPSEAAGAEILRLIREQRPAIGDVDVGEMIRSERPPTD